MMETDFRKSPHGTMVHANAADLEREAGSNRDQSFSDSHQPSLSWAQGESNVPVTRQLRPLGRSSNHPRPEGSRFAGQPLEPIKLFLFRGRREEGLQSHTA